MAMERQTWLAGLVAVNCGMSCCRQEADGSLKDGMAGQLLLTNGTLYPSEDNASQQTSMMMAGQIWRVLMVLMAFGA
jgi:hypothetical protein